MSKFTKAVIISSCILFFAGLLLALTSLAMGANPMLIAGRLNSMGVSDFYFSGHERFFGHNYDYDYGYGYNYNNGYSDNIVPPPAVTPPQSPDTALPWPAEAPIAPARLTPGDYDITELRFDFEAGDINIVQGDDFQIIYEGSRAGRYFYDRIEDNAWIIGSNIHNWGLLNLWRHDGADLKITVVLPRDFVAERMEIYLGAGNMRADSLRAGEMNFEVGLGNCQIGSLLAENADLNVGLGNLEARSFHAANARLEVGMGAMKLWLAQPLSQYRSKLEVGLGAVTLGNNRYSGVADISSGDADAAYQFDISCGIGSIIVRETAAE